MMHPANRIVFKYLRREYNALDRAQKFFLYSVIAFILLAAGVQFLLNEPLPATLSSASYIIFNAFMVLTSVAAQNLLSKILPEYEELKSKLEDQKKKAEATASAI
ncbi:MAG: hypothetical protein EOP10_13800 [Proteobacteria bacterium]|nr:MAG: hypothetical protein EOP10_13800 [Pseudomonadota bacterium]